MMIKKDNYFCTVLDHGFVRLVDSMGSDLSVVRAARVSYDAAARAGNDKGSDARLINYLWKHRHTSPFEAVTFTFEIYAPLFVIRQWQRHRTWSYNEMSGRYMAMGNKFYIPQAEHIGVQSVDNKQGRDCKGDTAESVLQRSKEADTLRLRSENAYAYYLSLLEAGWPRELARCALPLNTYSHMFVTVNLLNLFKFIDLRAAPDAQYEIRVYADALLELARDVVPTCVAAYERSRNGKGDKA